MKVSWYEFGMENEQGIFGVFVDNGVGIVVLGYCLFVRLGK